MLFKMGFLLKKKSKVGKLKNQEKQQTMARNKKSSKKRDDQPKTAKQLNDTYPPIF